MKRLIPAICIIWLTVSVTPNITTSTSSHVAVPRSPVAQADTIWVEDAIPAGAFAIGTWNWDTSLRAGGTLAHRTLSGRYSSALLSEHNTAVDD
jgi:hypothetical protein